jgi:hypothetical protein
VDQNGECPYAEHLSLEIPRELRMTDSLDEEKEPEYKAN